MTTITGHLEYRTNERSVPPLTVGLTLSNGRGNFLSRQHGSRTLTSSL